MKHRMGLQRGVLCVAVLLIAMAAIAPTFGGASNVFAALTAPSASLALSSAFKNAQARPSRQACTTTYTPTPSNSGVIETALALPLCAANDSSANDANDIASFKAMLIAYHVQQTKIVQPVKKTKVTVSRPSTPTAPKTTTTTSGGSSGGGGSSLGYLGPCGGSYPWTGSVGLWVAPTGCFGKIFSPSAVSSGTWASAGYCNWVPEALHHTNNLWGLPRSAVHAGAAVFFSGGVYGASSGGHWANVVSVHGSWMLIIEENFSWRGGGFGRVDYRFVPIGGGESFMG